MAAFSEDNDLGPIVVTVVLGTLVAGAFYLWLEPLRQGADRPEHSRHRADGADNCA
jgi:hypothetical protein